MDLNQFSTAMAQRGCTGAGNRFCGSFNGWPFTATYLLGKADSDVTFTIDVHCGMGNKGKKVLKEVKNRLGKEGRPSTLPSQESVLIRAAIGDAGFDRLFDGLLGTITAVMTDQGLAPVASCPYCAAPGCDSYAFIEGHYRAAHATCVHNRTAGEVEKAKKHENGSYLLGFVGALLGAFVGLIPTVLTIVFFERIYWILYALVPLASYQGYKLTRAPLVKASRWFVILATVIATPIGHYVITALQLMEVFDYFISVNDYIYFVQMFIEDFAQDYIVLVIAMVVGIAITWGSIGRSADEVVSGAAFGVESLRPIDPTAVGSQQPVQGPGGTAL